MKQRLIGASVMSLLFSFSAHSQSRPNVIFIAMDDENDWIGPFGGNPQILTPNLDRFCNENTMIFTNAHCTGPVSCPSRSALLSGFRPERTGCYGNDQNMLSSELIQQYATMPEYFSKNGYITISKGKIFHKHQTEKGRNQGQWAFDIWEQERGDQRPQRNKVTSRTDGLVDGVKIENQKYTGISGTDFAWAPTIAGKEETVDYKTAQWFAQQLNKEFEKPFFMAVGIAKPHLPWFVPQEYFDRYNLDSIKIPEFRLDDLDDILTPSGKKKFEPTNDFLWVRQDEKLFKSAVRAYMASTSYVDDCVGIIIDALKKSKYNDNTIIVIWGDHGWHLGEKLRFRKVTLWSESTRMPLIIKTPAMKNNGVCNRVVNLIDLYPTLIDLCGLPKRDILDGRSFAPLLKNPNKKWPYPSITTQAAGSFTVNDENWRYTIYNDGTEELYDLKNDPMEWTNLIRLNDKKANKAMAKLEKWIPKTSAPDLPSNQSADSDKEIYGGDESYNAIDNIRPLNKLR
jgi:arylsulfatase A-like enzyme